MELTPKTRKETFLAAAGGQDVTTPTPITREEVFLDAIAKGGGGGGGSSGGGVLVVHDVDGALDKTYKQIIDALHTNGVILEWAHENGMIEVYLVTDYGEADGTYLIGFHTNSSETSASGSYHYYIAESENGYPVNDD